MRLFTFLLSLLSIITLAQDGINYQGVATNGSGAELINQNISVKASVISDSTTGTVQWQETHNTTTDLFGLFNVVIGQGSSTGVGQTTNFDNINWGSSNHYLRIEMDATGGSNYSLISTSQMMSVPYALYAKSSGIDSTMLANMIGTSAGGGGCDFQFPEGLNGESVISQASVANPYIVPNGKRLYILNWKEGYPVINGIDIYFSAEGVMPIILNPGDTLTSPNNSTISGFSGLLVNENSGLTAITTEITDLIPYQVASGKKLVILNYIGDDIRLEGSYFFTDQGIVGIPFVIDAGTSIETSNNYNGVRFNGYLVDENYFANCGGGSSSSSASVVDSAMVAGMIANSVGGCNLKFPDGLEGFSINKTLSNNLNYIVPQSKRLYIIFKNGNTTLYINNIGVNYYGANFSSPIIANAGDTISSSSTCNIHGFIVEEKSQISAKSMTLNTLNYPHLNYIVPQSKRFYINSKTGNVSLYINNEIINYYGANFNTPKIVNAGDTIHAAGTTYINGFLVDEGYFSNCGGGISSSSNNSVSISPIGDTLFIGQQAIYIPGVSFNNAVRGTVTDGSGNLYETHNYGTAGEWMLEDLRTDHYNDGTLITGSSQTGASSSGYSTGSVRYLYDYYTAFNSSKNVCPVGWRIPTRIEWYNLISLFSDTSAVPATYCNTVINPPSLSFNNINELLSNGWSVPYNNISGFSMIGPSYEYYTSDQAPQPCFVFYSAAYPTSYFYIDFNETSISTGYSYGIGGGEKPIRCIKD